MKEVRILATTVQGLEWFVCEELREICGEVRVFSAREGSGRVIAEIDERCLAILMEKARSVEKVYLFFGEAASIEEAGIDLSEKLREFSGFFRFFSVHAERITKDIDLTSLEIAAKIGEMVKTRLNLDVSLDFPDIPVYVEYEKGVYRYGVDLCFHRSLRDRPYRRFIHRSALNPLIAYALCRAVRGGKSLWDPFCGSGTIPLECLEVYPWARAVCSDVNAEFIAGALQNSLAVGKELDLVVSDIRSAPLRSGSIDAVVTNPPFGIREKAVGGLRKVYEALFAEASRVLVQGGRLAVLTPHRKLVESLAQKHSFLKVGEWRLNEGGLLSYMLLYSRE